MTLPDPGAATPKESTVKEIQAAIEKWDREDPLAKGTVTLNMMDVTGCGVEADEATAHEFWKRLLAVRERKSELASMNAEEYLKSCKYAANSDLNAHFVELRRRRKACRDIGSNVTDQRFAIIICHSMGESLRH